MQGGQRGHEDEELDVQERVLRRARVEAQPPLDIPEWVVMVAEALEDQVLLLEELELELGEVEARGGWVEIE